MFNRIFGVGGWPWIAGIALCVAAEVAASTAQIDDFSGWGVIPGVVLSVVANFIPPGGLFTLSPLAFFGAWKLWHWEWWQALLLALSSTIYLAATHTIPNIVRARRRCE